MERGYLATVAYPESRTGVAPFHFAVFVIPAFDQFGLFQAGQGVILKSGDPLEG